MIQFLLEPEAYCLLKTEGGKVELLTKSELSVYFRNLNGRVQKIAKEMLEAREAKLPLLEFATQLKSLALRVEDEFQSLLLIRYACDIIEKTIVARVDKLSELYEKLKKKRVPSDILKSLKSNITATTKAILTSSPKVSNTTYNTLIKNLAGLLEVEKPEEPVRPPEKPKIPTEEAAEKEEAELMEEEEAEEAVVEAEVIVKLLTEKARTLSELSKDLKISKEVVFDKMEPLIRNDEILLKAKGKGKK